RYLRRYPECDGDKAFLLRLRAALCRTSLDHWPISKNSRKPNVFNKGGGRGGIRTHGALAGTPVFKTGALNHSATLPVQRISNRLAQRLAERNANLDPIWPGSPFAQERKEESRQHVHRLAPRPATAPAPVAPLHPLLRGRNRSRMATTVNVTKATKTNPSACE